MTKKLDRTTDDLQRMFLRVQATIDYRIEHETGFIVTDGEDIIADYFRGQKALSEQYLRDRKLGQLKKQWARLANSLKLDADLSFMDYLRQKTGEDVDLFEGLDLNVATIVAQGSIRTEKDLLDIQTQLLLLNKQGVPPEKYKQLSDLLQAYEIPKPRGYTTSTVTEENEEGLSIVRETFTTGRKPKYQAEKRHVSPDGERIIFVHEISKDGKQGYTSVQLQYKGASGVIFAAAGFRLGIDAEWIGNDAIEIRRPADVRVMMATETVQSRETTIHVKYVDV